MHAQRNLTALEARLRAAGNWPPAPGSTEQRRPSTFLTGQNTENYEELYAAEQGLSLPEWRARETEEAAKRVAERKRVAEEAARERRKREAEEAAVEAWLS